MDEITIIPLFNQDPVIWNNFLSVRCDAIRGAYNHELTSGECDFMLKDLAKAWHRRAHNFAYAAYHDKTMVGFVQGDCMSNIATMRGLYVRSEYQKCGIVSAFRQYGGDLMRTVRFRCRSACAF